MRRHRFEVVKLTELIASLAAVTDNEKTAPPKARLFYFLFQELLQLEQKIDPNVFSGY